MKNKHPMDRYVAPDGSVYTLGKHDPRRKRSMVIKRRIRRCGSQLEVETTAPRWVSWDELPAELFR